LPDDQLILYGEGLRLLEGTLRDLWRDANAKAVFVIDRNGMELASAGDVSQFDVTSLSSLSSLSSLAAGNVATTDGLAKLIGEREFSVLFHEGHQDHIHISVVVGRGRTGAPFPRSRTRTSRLFSATDDPFGRVSRFCCRQPGGALRRQYRIGAESREQSGGARPRSRKHSVRAAIQ
jgi:hypothetical protein